MTRTQCVWTAIVTAVLVGVVFCASASAQQLVSTKGKVRVFKGGLTVEGTNLEVNGESVSLTVAGQTTFLDLKDIDRVDVRKGRAMKGACIGGGGCFAIGMLACTAADEGTFQESGGDRGQCYVGSMIWSGLFAGAGALIGNASSSWETVFYRTRTGIEESDSVGFAQLASPDRAHVTFVVIPPRSCCGGVVGLSVAF